MTINEVIKAVNDVKPHSFSNDTLTMWLNEVEGMVQTDVMLLCLADIITYTYDENSETELLVKAPHSRIYYQYLIAMVDFANNEYDKYANTLELFNKFYADYMRWYALNVNPGNGKADVAGYYISAYALAVKHGYTGTEKEWIDSLNRAKEYSEKAYEYSQKSKESAEETDALSESASKSAEKSEEQALFSKSYAVGGTGVRDGEDVDNAQYYADLSGQFQVDARASANRTSELKKDAEQSATQASNSASKASTSEANAKEYAEKAETHESNACEYAQEAKGYSETSQKASEEAKDYAEKSKGYSEESKKYAGLSNPDSYSNALKGNANAVNALRIDNISPIEHTMGVKVRSKNIFNLESSDFNVDPSDTGHTTNSKDDWSKLSANSLEVTLKPEHGRAYAEIAIEEYNELIQSLDGKSITLSVNGGLREAVPNEEKEADYIQIGVKYHGNKYECSHSKYSDEKNICTHTFNHQGRKVQYLVVRPFTCGKNQDMYGKISISDIQLEWGNKATPYTPYVDISKVKVSTYGQNLLDIDKGLNECLVKNDDGTYTITKFDNNYRFSASIPFDVPTNKVNVTDKVFVFSMYAEIVDTNIENQDRVPLIFYNEGMVETFTGAMNEKCFSYTTSKFERVNNVKVWLGNDVSDGAYITFKNPQIAIAYYPDYVLDYEPFVEPIECAVNTDGTVEGVTSLSPTTTLVSDNGVVIEVEYNKDINKAYESQQAEIAELKAMILNLT